MTTTTHSRLQMMQTLLRRTTLTTCLLTTLSASIPMQAQAQPQAAPNLPAEGTPPANEVQILYENALQAIAEGRKNDASNTLVQVIEKESLHAGAYLEVALVQCSLGHLTEAERLFAIIETRFDPPRAILELIAEARETGCDQWEPLSSTSVSVTRGQDMNVNQGARNPSYIIEQDGGQIELPLQADFLPQHDQYTSVSVEHTRDLTPNGISGFAQFFGRRNDSLNQYDSNSLYGGIDSQYRFGAWPVRASGLVGLTALGGKLYQRQLQLLARTGVPVPLPPTMQLHVTGGVARNDYLTLTNFDSYAYDLLGQLTWRGSKTYASLTQGWQADHAVRNRPGGDRHGFSTTILARRALWGDLSGELSYSRQNWRSSEAYAPGLINTVRDQDTHVARAMLTWPIARNQWLRLETRFVRNRENISIFQYDNRQIQLSWQWQNR
jgi:hypothetical protein